MAVPAPNAPKRWEPDPCKMLTHFLSRPPPLVTLYSTQSWFALLFSVTRDVFNKQGANTVSQNLM